MTLDAGHGLDHFTTSEYILSVTTSDGSLDDTKDLTVTILNTLDPPEFVGLTTISVGELSMGLVHVIQFTDPDLDENVTCTMIDVFESVNTSFDLSTSGKLLRRNGIVRFSYSLFGKT